MGSALHDSLRAFFFIPKCSKNPKNPPKSTTCASQICANSVRKHLNAERGTGNVEIGSFLAFAFAFSLRPFHSFLSLRSIQSYFGNCSMEKFKLMPLGNTTATEGLHRGYRSFLRLDVRSAKNPAPSAKRGIKTDSKLISCADTPPMRQRQCWKARTWKVPEPEERRRTQVPDQTRPPAKSRWRWMTT